MSEEIKPVKVSAKSWAEEIKPVKVSAKPFKVSAKVSKFESSPSKFQAMSEGSINSVESQNVRKCRCGLNALNLTAWTDVNAGRRFYKCPRPKVHSCGYWEWQDKQQLPQRAVTVILDLKGKLDAMKVERNRLKRIVDGMEVVERENMSTIVDNMKAISFERDSFKKKLEEIDVVHVQEAAEISILKEKVEELQFTSDQEAGKVTILERKIKKLKAIIFISCTLFVVFLLGRMK